MELFYLLMKPKDTLMLFKKNLHLLNAYLRVNNRFFKSSLQFKNIYFISGNMEE